MAYFHRSTVTIEASFKDGTAPVDPATVVFSVLRPNRQVDVFTFGVDAAGARLSAGAFVLRLTLPASGGVGRWHVRAVGTGIGTSGDVAVQEESFELRISAFPA